MIRRHRLAAPGAAPAALLPVTIPFAVVVGKRQTTILSPPQDSGLPPANGGSDNVTFSQDNRNVRVIAWDTSASNLTNGDNNSKRDVIIAKREAGEGNL